MRWCGASWLLVAGFLAALAAGCRRVRGSEVVVQSAASERVREAFPWVPDQGDGTFQNPVIFADYSDPDVIRVGAEYYLIASSFNCTPALPILSSRDLVNWKIAGHALENLPNSRYEDVQHGAGIWAPALREHAGTFYIFAPLPDEGIYVLTAPHPLGPWSDPVLLIAGKGLIDPCPLWDDDGKAYLVHAYARSRSGIKDRLRVRPMTPDARHVLGEGQIVFEDASRYPTLEGPKFYKRNGWYYILAPAGGVTQGWQVALRSRTVFGPYEDRIVLEQGQTAINGPHQGALVDTPEGEWWFLHFQDAGVYGRVVHLNPVTWQDDWPLLGRASAGGTRREPVLSYRKPRGLAQPPSIPQTSDEFDALHLGQQWQWQANHKDTWYSLGVRPGFLRLFPEYLPRADFHWAPNLLLQKLPARAFTAETRLELAGTLGATRAGLIVMGESHAALSVEEVPEGRRVALRIDGRVVRADIVPAGEVRLGVAMADGGRCHFFYQARGGKERTLDADFQARAGRWIGAKVGLYAIAPERRDPPGHADFEYFRFGLL